MTPANITLPAVVREAVSEDGVPEPWVSHLRAATQRRRGRR